MPAIIIAPLAEKDLEDIWYYIAEDNPNQANLLLKAIKEKIELIAENRKMGAFTRRVIHEIEEFCSGKLCYLLFSNRAWN